MADSELFSEVGTNIHNFYLDEKGVLRVAKMCKNRKLDFRKERLVVPSSYIPSVLKGYHDDRMGGHMGADKTYLRLSCLYFWSWMHSSVSEYVRGCPLCQRHKLGTGEGATAVGRVDEPDINQLIVLNACSPLKETKSGFCHIVCIIEYTTHYV